MEVEGKLGMEIGEWLTGMVKEAASLWPQLSFRFRVYKMEGRCDRGDDRIELLGAPVPPRHSASPWANSNVPNTGDAYEED